MTEAEYAAYVPRATEAYAIEVARNNLVSEEEGRARSRRSFETELPDGITPPTSGSSSRRMPKGDWSATCGSRGRLRPTPLFIYDIEVVAERRGEGFGRRLMELVEVEGRVMGLGRIELNVHADNEVARSLYESAGYRGDAPPDGQAARLTLGKDRPETRS